MSSLEPLSLSLSILLLILSTYLGISLHELTHWIVARWWTDSAIIRFDYLVVPSYVDLQGVQLPHQAIRTIGASPFAIWFVPLLGFVFWFVIPSWNEHGLESLGLALFPISSVILITSPSDVLATLFPSAWRDRYPAGETEYELSHRKDLLALTREVRKRI